MTQNNNRTSFYEVVFRGKPKVVRAFMAGLLMGASKDAQVIYSFQAGIHHEGKVEKLAEMVGIRADEVHAIVDGDTSALLKKLNRSIAARTGLEITSHRNIRSASMAFSFQAFARKYDDDIVALLEGLPLGLKLADYKHDVVVDPKAKGVEAYTVAHDFEASGKGKISGAIDDLVAFKQTLKDYPLVTADDIVLKLA